MPTPRAMAAGWTTPWPSSNSWIKTARSEDNEVEATVEARDESMPTSPLSVVIQHLLADLKPDRGGMTDGELLARFLSSRDDDARHGRLGATDQVVFMHTGGTPAVFAYRDELMG